MKSTVCLQCQQPIAIVYTLKGRAIEVETTTFYLIDYTDQLGRTYVSEKKLLAQHRCRKAA